MTSISAGFAGTTTDRLGNSVTPGSGEKGSRTSPAQSTPRSQMAAASELGGYYAHKPCLCSSLQTSQVIYGQKPGQQRPIFTIGRPESRIAGRRLGRRF